jgi:predicted amidohydrolase
MSSTPVRVAVTQAEPAWLDLAAGVSKTCELIAEAAQNKAKLIAFPECWIPGYPCWIWYVYRNYIVLNYTKECLPGAACWTLR